MSKEMNKYEYWAGYPGDCPYYTDLNWVRGISVNYLKKIAPVIKAAGKTGIVVFDIDDTLVFGDPAKVVGVQEMVVGKMNGQEIFLLPPNPQIVQVAQFAKSLGFKIVALTARPKESKMASIRNLQDFKIPYDMLIMNEKDEDPFFKIGIRRLLEKPNQTVVLTLGDQPCDCIFPGTGAAIKLPDEDSFCAYAYIP